MSKITDVQYYVRAETGTLTATETLTVSGDPNKTVTNAGSYPYFGGSSITKDAYVFYDHSTASLSNYNDIPNSWKNV